MPSNEAGEAQVRRSMRTSRSLTIELEPPAEAAPGLNAPWNFGIGFALPREFREHGADRGAEAYLSSEAAQRRRFPRIALRLVLVVRAMGYGDQRPVAIPLGRPRSRRPGDRFSGGSAAIAGAAGIKEHRRQRMPKTGIRRFLRSMAHPLGSG